MILAGMSVIALWTCFYLSTYFCLFARLVKCFASFVFVILSDQYNDGLVVNSSKIPCNVSHPVFVVRVEYVFMKFSCERKHVHALTPCLEQFLLVRKLSEAQSLADEGNFATYMMLLMAAQFDISD